MSRRSQFGCSLTGFAVAFFHGEHSRGLVVRGGKGDRGRKAVIVAIPDSSLLYWRLEEAGLGTQAGSISGTTSLQPDRSRGRDPGAPTERQAPHGPEGHWLPRPCGGGRDATRPEAADRGTLGPALRSYCVTE